MEAAKSFHLLSVLPPLIPAAQQLIQSVDVVEGVDQSSDETAELAAAFINTSLASSHSASVGRVPPPIHSH